MRAPVCHCAKQGSKAKIQPHPAGHPAGFAVPWQPLPLSLQEQHPYFYRANPGQRAGVALIHPSTKHNTQARAGAGNKVLFR